ALSVVSLAGGAFVILNSFLMNLGERRRQLAILRALGATRRQVTWLLLREAILLGGAGTVLGMGVGVLLASGLVRIYEQLLGAKLPPLELTAEPFLLALFFGPAMTLAATMVPARRAGRRSPLEAMLPKRSISEPREFHATWTAWLGLACMLLTLVFVVGGLRGWWSPALLAILMGPAT